MYRTHKPFINPMESRRVKKKAGCYLKCLIIQIRRRHWILGHGHVRYTGLDQKLSERIPLRKVNWRQIWITLAEDPNHVPKPCDSDRDGTFLSVALNATNSILFQRKDSLITILKLSGGKKRVSISIRSFNIGDETVPDIGRFRLGL